MVCGGAALSVSGRKVRETIAPVVYIPTLNNNSNMETRQRSVSWPTAKDDIYEYQIYISSDLVA